MKKEEKEVTNLAVKIASLIHRENPEPMVVTAALELILGSMLLSLSKHTEVSLEQICKDSFESIQEFINLSMMTGDGEQQAN